MARALLDSALIVKVEAGTASGTHNIYDFHHIHPSVASAELSAGTAHHVALADGVYVIDDHLE
jgi:hypothetical protein